MTFDDNADDGFRQKQREKKAQNELEREGRSPSYSNSNNRYSNTSYGNDKPRSYDRSGGSSFRDRNDRQERSYRDDRGGRSSYQSRDNGFRSNYRENSFNNDDRFTPKERDERSPRQDRGYQPRPRYNDDFKPRDSFDSRRSNSQRFPSRDSFGTDAPFEAKQKPYATKQARSEDDFFSPEIRPRNSFSNKHFDRERPQRDFGDRPQRDFGDRPQRDFGDRPQRDFGDRPKRDFGDRPQRDFGDRPQRDFSDRPQRDFGYNAQGEFGERRPFREREGRTSRFRESTDSLFAIDKEILHLLFKRAEFLQQVKRDNRVEPALEKKLRASWERGAARVTRDPRIGRDFFNLLQQIEPIPLVDGIPMYFNLAPVFAPAKLDITAPVCSRQLRIFLAIAASVGANTCFQVDLSPTMMSAIKAFNQLGGQLWWEGDGKVFSRGGEGITRHIDRVIPVGEDPFSFYLALSMALLVPSRLKFVGDGNLRFLSTSELRRFLPQLNARMSVVIPGHDGIPVRAESVGMLPQTIHFPSTIPADFIISLILISVARQDVEDSLDFSIDNHPEAERILSEVLSVLDELDIPNSSEQDGKILKISFTPIEPSFNEDLKIELEAEVAATLLAIPAFVGGKATLKGAFNETDEVYINFLKSSGLSIEVENMQIIAERKGNALLQPDYTTSPSYPLALVFAALGVYNGYDVQFPSTPDEVEEDIAKSFLEQVGIAVNADGKLEKVAPNANPWFVPNAQWGLALSLAAFIRPHIRITNPDIVSAIYPTFWKIYNALGATHAQASISQENENAESENVEENPIRRYIVESPVVLAGTAPDIEDPENLEYINDENFTEENLLDTIEHSSPKNYEEEEEE